MKVTPARRLLWALKYGDPQELLRPLQWIIPISVVLWTLFMWVLRELGEL